MSSQHIFQSDRMNKILSRVSLYGSKPFVPISIRKIEENSGTFITYNWAVLVNRNDVDFYRNGKWENELDCYEPSIVDEGNQERMHLDIIREKRDGVENIALYREFYINSIPEQSRLCEDFVLMFNLYYDESEKVYYDILPTGEKEKVAYVENESELYVQLQYLFRYASAKRKALILYFQYIYSAHNIKLGQNNYFEREGQIRNIYIHLQANYQASEYSEVIRGKKILLPGRLECSQLYPFYKDEKETVSFITRIDEWGEPIEHFPSGKSASAEGERADFLTPVCFKRLVLEKYYNNSELYSISDGSIACGSLWGISIDADHDDCVFAWLGDLGAIPTKEQEHWKLHNVTPLTGVSMTKLKRDLSCNFCDPASLDFLFIQRWRELHQSLNMCVEPAPYSKLSKNDIKHLHSIHRPFHNSEEELKQLALSLTMLLIEALDTSFFKANLSNTNIKYQGTINWFQAWLEEHIAPNDFEKPISFLRSLQSYRSAAIAHRTSDKYAEAAAKIGINGNNFEEISNSLLSSAIEYSNFVSKHIVPLLKEKSNECFADILSNISPQ